MIRLRCRLLGCESYDNAQQCLRCGEWLYADRWLNFGWLHVILWRLQWIASFRKVLANAWPWRKCEECGGNFFRWKPSRDGNFCSKRCAEEWIPL